MNNNVKNIYTSKITGIALCCAGMLFVFAVAMLSSCTLEMSDNGHLDGYWQLTTVDTLTNGKSEDVRERLLFLSVEKDLLRLCDQGNATVDCYCRFEKTSSSLRIYNPYRNDRPNATHKSGIVAHFRIRKPRCHLRHRKTLVGYNDSFRQTSAAALQKAIGSRIPHAIGFRS